MPWYAWAVIAYIAADRLLTIAWVGKDFEITPAIAVETTITGCLVIWAVVVLAT
jgi:hypothetical protein